MSSSPILIPNSTGVYGDVVIESPVRVYNYCEFSNVFIGAFTHIASYAWLLETEVGRYCSIGDGVHIVSEEPINMLTTSPLLYSTMFDELFQVTKKVAYSTLKKTIIGNDVWIGSGAKIKTGLIIGDGAIVGAGSVVTKNVAPYSIVGGVPARHIKMRFPPKIIFRLKKLAWWKYNLVDYDLTWDNIEISLQQLEELALEKKLSFYAPPTYKVWKEGEMIKGNPVNHRVTG